MSYQVRVFGSSGSTVDPILTLPTGETLRVDRNRLLYSPNQSLDLPNHYHFPDETLLVLSQGDLYFRTFHLRCITVFGSLFFLGSHPGEDDFGRPFIKIFGGFSYAGYSDPIFDQLKSLNRLNEYEDWDLEHNQGLSTPFKIHSKGREVLSPQVIKETPRRPEIEDYYLRWVESSLFIEGNPDGALWLSRVRSSLTQDVTSSSTSPRLSVLK